MEIKTKLCNPANYGKSRGDSTISYIVIHYTSNLGDTAKNNADYFAREVVEASAHYFVDENEIWNSVPPEYPAWHCGGGLQGENGHTFFHQCRNANSIGVEICMTDRTGQVRMGSIAHAAKLVQMLMDKYHVGISHIIRHYDVTGKDCPAPMASDPNLWAAFKKQLASEEVLDMRYQYYDDMPVWAQPTISKLVKKGLLKGSGDGVLDLGEDALKILVVNDRAGLYDA